MEKTRFIALGMACAILIPACGGGGGGGGNSNPSPDPDPDPPPPVVTAFVDATPASNIQYVVGITPPGMLTEVHEVTFGGAAVGDCDADGDEDLFITYGDAGPNRLYLNRLVETGTPLLFEDVAAGGLANTRENRDPPDSGRNDRHSGPTFADMDGDGDLDLFIGGLFGDPSYIFRNDGNCSFEDVTEGSGIDTLLVENTISAGFGDYDLDGDLDLFLTHWGSQDVFGPGEESEHLFRNISSGGEIRFENVSLASGVTDILVDTRTLYATRDTGSDYTFAPTFALINDDIWPDIAVSSDFSTTVLLLQDAAAPGTFIDGSSPDVHAVQYGMGSALGDIDFDGDLDWFVTSIFSNVEPSPGPGRDRPIGNHLYLNPGGDFSLDRFTNIAVGAGVDEGGWGWGTCLLDIDNDTDLDLYHTNGWYMTFLDDGSYLTDQSRLFLSDAANDSVNLQFAEESVDYGLDDSNSGRGVVCADFDNDGDVDILQLTDNAANSATLWENDSAAAGRNFLRVRLLGLPPNTEAAGARIHLTIGGRTQMREIMIGSNYTSQNPAVQVFGLDTATTIDELRVEWPLRQPGLVPPDDWVSTNRSTGIAGETLVICHPELTSPPAVCAAE